MEFKIEKFASARAIETLRTAGLHKIAGAMAGVDEITLKEAAATLGAKAYLNRRETQKIAAGLQALADLNGEKIAEGVWSQLAARAMPHALGGAAIATIPQLMKDGPTDPNDLLTSALLGGGLGMAGGMAGGLNRTLQANPALDNQLAAALRR